MPGLLRGVARTAVVAGTATAVSGNVRRRQEARWAAKEEPVQAAQPVSQAPAGDSDIDELQRLAQLKEQGVITEEEFAAKKKQILGI
jgi:hypothetical protein